MFSRSNARTNTDAPRMPVRAKKVPFRKIACFLYDLQRFAFKNMDGLAVVVLDGPRSHRSQRRWASAVRRSDDARKLLEMYAQNRGLEQPLTSGGARAFLAQILNKNDAAAIIHELEKSNENKTIVAYLKKTHCLEEPIIE